MKEKRINPHFYLCRRIIASVITLLICVAVLAVPNVNKNERLFNQMSAAARDRLPVAESFGNSNDTITPNKWYRSPNGEYFLVFSKSEGNLVIYHETKYGREPVWTSGPRAKDAKCVLQHEGNLVIYSPNAQNGILWNTETHSEKGATLVLTNSGDLYIYSKSDQKIIWQSRPCMWPLPGSEKGSPLTKKEYQEGRHRCLEIFGGHAHEDYLESLNAVATYDGEVTNVDYKDRYVTIYHRKLGIYSTYGPLNYIKVKERDKVKQNDILGKASGWSFYFHISTDNPRNNLHPNYVDPYLYIAPPSNELFIKPKY